MSYTARISDAQRERLSDLDIGVIYTHEDHFMDPLLSTMARSANGYSLRLILVDNASDGGVSRWRSYVPQTVVVRNERRLGYAENLNRILAASNGRYVLLMNTDMYFDPSEQCLAKMIAFMDGDPACGLSICRLYHADGTYGYPARRFQTARIVAARRLGAERLFAGSLDRYLYRERDPHDTFACDWVSGCFLMLRREAWREVGLFDTGFRKYFEDVDMCHRVWRAGWSVMFHGGTYAYHVEQRASRRLLSSDAWLHACSYLRWLYKWGWRTPPAAEAMRANLPPRRAAIADRVA